MSERTKPPVRLNLAGKNLSRILMSLEELGWKTNQHALKFVNLSTMMTDGDMKKAQFWHTRPNDIDGEHKDTLLYVGNSLIRECSRDGQELISWHW